MRLWEAFSSSGGLTDQAHIEQSELSASSDSVSLQNASVLLSLAMHQENRPNIPPQSRCIDSTAAEIQKILNSNQARSSAELLQFSLPLSSFTPSQTAHSSQTLPPIGQAIPSIQTLGLSTPTLHNSNVAGSFVPQASFLARPLVSIAPPLDLLALSRHMSVHAAPCRPQQTPGASQTSSTSFSAGSRVSMFTSVDPSLISGSSRSFASAPAQPSRSSSVNMLGSTTHGIGGDSDSKGELAMAHGDEGLSRIGQSNQIDSFRRFLYDLMSKEVVIVEELKEGDIACDQELNPLAIKAWRVLKIDDWWVAVKQWFQHDASKFNMRAFFMMLRRIGFRPFNKAPAPATSGMDYALRNKFVSDHGYIFDCETLEKYCQSRRILTKLKRKMAAASGEGSDDTMESNTTRRKIMD